jgi:hypothetical protein
LIQLQDGDELLFEIHPTLSWLKEIR